MFSYFMTPLVFAGLISIPFLVIHYFLVRGESKKIKILLWSVFTVKLFLALTMGYFDVFWFITFIQNFIANPSENPWIYTEMTVFAKFHYPPLLLYIHAGIMALFKPLLNLEFPYWPTPYSFSIFKIPFLIFDLMFLKFFLEQKRSGCSKSALSSFLFYLLNPFLLIQEYYTGQMDWIAIFPFFLAVIEFEKNRLSRKFLILFTISLMLKPFGILFLPVILLDLLPNIVRGKMKLLKDMGALAISILIWKLSEMPYLFSDGYEADVGVGAAERIIGNSHFFPFPIFALAYLLLLAYWMYDAVKDKSCKASERIVVVTLALGGLGHPTYGWLLWCLPFVIQLLSEGKMKHLSLWWIWCFIFGLKYFFHDGSPFFSSFGLFVTYFLKFDYSFPAGMPVLYLQNHFGDNITHLIQNGIGIIWRFSNLLLASLILSGKNAFSLRRFVCSLKIMLVLLLTGCSPAEKNICDGKYNYEFKIHEKTKIANELHSIECCVKDPQFKRPYCIPENRNVVVPLVFPPNFKGQELEYELKNKKTNESRLFKYEP